ncbi:Retrotransposon-derived protein PEG10 [Rhizoctonia solani]|uniref:Retrotransposon-derived protein PEG10 n=1 Tax=Rhizoctonia solani TaxID=456999 RepID=A0A8H8T139_9AGAM|nr:Retrotransposon-derived protein PEG10 [Rhizoctonia solani]XP_043185393.1 Retrotransposon-derived protein PEG10 [Rhizoctonia solani]QRW24103.1 Retrotransposon-derived protein PEG10 [Rhizoctonia solani]QRW25156.1 Retrotransposon-derived protein PEG10 [Rhizoctonia solani]
MPSPIFPPHTLVSLTPTHIPQATPPIAQFQPIPNHPLAVHLPLHETCPEWNQSQHLLLSSRLSKPYPPKLGPCRTKSSPRAKSSPSSLPYAGRPTTLSWIRIKESLAQQLGLQPPPGQQGGQTKTPGMVRPGHKAPFKPLRRPGFVYNSKEEEPWPEEPCRQIKKEPCSMPRDLRALTPFDSSSNTKHPKMELPDPFKGNTRAHKAFDKDEQMVVWILYHMEDKAADWALPLIGNIIKGEGNAPTTIPGLTVHFKEAFANPNAKQAAACKIAALTQTASMAEYVTKFCNLIAELDWNEEAYIAQFTRSLHWKVKELLSTKDNIPDNLEAVMP